MTTSLLCHIPLVYTHNSGDSCPRVLVLLLNIPGSLINHLSARYVPVNEETGPSELERYCRSLAVLPPPLSDP